MRLHIERLIFIAQYKQLILYIIGKEIIEGPAKKTDPRILASYSIGPNFKPNFISSTTLPLIQGFLLNMYVHQNKKVCSAC